MVGQGAGSELPSPASAEEAASLKKRSMDEFSIEKDLGMGAYGKVYLASDKLTDKVVAIKCVNKEQIIRMDKKRHVYREKNLLSQLQHPFIIKLITTMIVRSGTL
jgi:serine/threonine protein kinase